MAPAPATATAAAVHLRSVKTGAASVTCGSGEAPFVALGGSAEQEVQHSARLEVPGAYGKQHQSVRKRVIDAVGWLSWCVLIGHRRHREVHDTPIHLVHIPCFLFFFDRGASAG